MKVLILGLTLLTSMSTCADSFFNGNFYIEGSLKSGEVCIQGDWVTPVTEIILTEEQIKQVLNDNAEEE